MSSEMVDLGVDLGKDVAEHILSNRIEKHCEKKCNESNSVIEKGVYGTARVMSMLGCVGAVIEFAFDAVGGVLSHIFKN